MGAALAEYFAGIIGMAFVVGVLVGVAGSFLVPWLIHHITIGWAQ